MTRPATMGLAAIGGGDLINFLRQFTPYPIAKDGYLTSRDFRPAEVALRSRVTAALASTPPLTEAEYQVPEPWNLLIFGIRGVVAFNDPDGETAAIAGLGNPDLDDRIKLKAMNARVNLVNVTLDGVKLIGEQNDLPLSAIMPENGGLTWKFPVVIPGAYKLKMGISFLDTAAAIMGGSTDYGLALDAWLLRRTDG